MKTISKLVFLILITFVSSLHSQDWVVTYIGQPNTLKGIYLLDNNTGYVVGTGVFLKTTNAGTNWSVSTSRYDLSGVYFLNSQTGFAVGKSNDSVFVIKTTDNGGTWSSYYLTYYTNFDFGRVFFKDNNTGYIVFPNIGYYRTTNGGLFWILKAFAYDATQDVKWIGNLFYRTGSTQIQGYMKPAFWTSTDEINWSATNYCAECDNSEYGISYSHYDTVDYFVTNQVGYNLWRKTVPHQYWQGVTQGEYGSPYFFNDEANIHHGESYNSICYLYASSNAGYSWIADTLQDFSIKGLYFSNLNTGFAVGSNGLIAKTTNGGGTIGIQTISTQVPKQFSLSQNYPNPFNPSTNITFDITTKGNVKLSIYDMLGREVATLVNQQLLPGNYKADWDGSNYTSGIYFYKLEANSIQLTKKMVLLK